VFGACVQAFILYVFIYIYIFSHFFFFISFFSPILFFFKHTHPMNIGTHTVPVGVPALPWYISKYSFFPFHAYNTFFFFNTPLLPRSSFFFLVCVCVVSVCAGRVRVRVVGCVRGWRLFFAVCASGSVVPFASPHAPVPVRQQSGSIPQLETTSEEGKWRCVR
jgi:hypothetical protein